jgi:hypothetical protein
VTASPSFAASRGGSFHGVTSTIVSPDDRWFDLMSSGMGTEAGIERMCRNNFQTRSNRIEYRDFEKCSQFF